MEKQTIPTNYGALTTLTTVFFFWGFIAAGNSIFIPFCKHFFKLDQFQSQLIDFAFYGAYYIGALLLFLFGTSKGKDLIGSWGYKRSIVGGLLFSAFGAAQMIVSVNQESFMGMLIGLFVVALGFSIQQTAANPFMISLGDESTGSNRISLGGSINSLGTSIGPIIIAATLFGTTKAVSDEMIAKLSLSKVVILYTAVGLLFVGVAALFGFSKKVPNGIVLTKDLEKEEGANKAVITLLVMTLALVACFTPVLNSYRSDEAKQLNELHHDLEMIEMDLLVNKSTEDFSTDLKSAGMPGELAGEMEELVSSALGQGKAELQATKDIITAEISKLESGLNQMRILCWTAGLAAVLVCLGFAAWNSQSNSSAWGAMKYPQLTLGMLAIFVYVGVEVAIGSNLGELMKKESFGGLSSSEITPYISMYWGSLMIGRWAGSINAFPLKDNLKVVLRFIVPFVAFLVVIGFTSLSGYPVNNLWGYALCIIIQVLAFYFTKDKPVSTLVLFGALGTISVLIGMFTSGSIAIYAFLSAGLFCSIMWPCIFSLALAGLGKYQAQGAAFLVMMILGGAIIPPLQGKLSDIIGIQTSFIVGVICFLYITIFALVVNKVLKNQGVSLE